MDKAADSVQNEHILELKQAVARLSIICEDQRYCMTRGSACACVLLLQCGFPQPVQVTILARADTVGCDHEHRLGGITGIQELSVGLAVGH